MAETKTNGNAAAEGQKITVSAHGQFIRDMSFENFAAQRKEWAPHKLEHEIQLLLDLSEGGKNVYVVSVKLILDAKGGGQPVYLLEIDYCGLFEIKNLPEAQLRPYLAVQCPQMIFPFLRRIVADITRDGGYPPYNLDLINFAAIYQKELLRQRAAAAADAKTED